MSSAKINLKPKIAIFYPFLIGSCKGGGEKLTLDTRDYYGADLFVGSLEESAWGQDIPTRDDFTNQLWNHKGKVISFGSESKIPLWRYLKRQLLLKFSPKINQLVQYEAVYLSFGNISFVPQRLKKLNPKIKLIAYINTPPRGFTDQFETKLQQKVPKILQPAVRLFQKFVIREFKAAADACDYKIANSKNIQNRLKTYCNVEVDEVIWPAIDTQKLKYVGQKDYYLSHARLESTKRLELIVEAFALMPDRKLVITSGGPLKDWIIQTIAERKLVNIEFKGRVSDSERDQLMGNCIAGIYIPENEDSGMTQVELNACAKPVIGVAEGGLLETIFEGQNGLLLPANPKVEDLVAAVKKMTPELAWSMKQACLSNAAKLDKKVYFDRLDKILLNK